MTPPLTPGDITAATGRELDALVAEHVFDLGRNLRLVGTTETVRIFTNNPFYKDGQCCRNDLHHVIRPPAYSTDGNAMLAVLERMRERRFQLFIASPAIWHVEAWSDDPHESVACISCESESLPEAICRTSLLALARAQKEGAQ